MANMEETMIRIEFLDGMIKNAYDSVAYALGDREIAKLDGDNYMTKVYQILNQDDDGGNILLLKYHLFALLEEMTNLQDEYNHAIYACQCDEDDEDPGGLYGDDVDSCSSP